MRKLRLLAVPLILGLYTLMITAPVSATGSSTFQLSPGTSTITLGTPLVVSVEIYGTTMTAIDSELSYNSTYLTIVGITPGVTWPAVVHNSYTGSSITFSTGSFTTTPSAGTLYDVTFNTVALTSGTTISVSGEAAYNGAGISCTGDTETYSIVTPTTTTPPATNPSVTTGYSSPSVSTEGASVNNYCASMGYPSIVTTWGTNWGLTASYGTIITNTGTKTAAFTWSDPITGLTAATLYDYQAYAANSNGTGVGLNNTFLTAPDAPTALAVGSVSSTSVPVTWVAAVGETSPTAVTIETEVLCNASPIPSPTYSSSCSSSIAWVSGTNGTIPGLTPNTTYYLYAFSEVKYTGATTRYSTTYASVTVTTAPGTTTSAIITATLVPPVVTNIVGPNTSSAVTSNFPLYGIFAMMGTLLNVPTDIMINIGVIFLIVSLGIMCIVAKLGPLITGGVMIIIAVVLLEMYVFSYWQVFMMIAFVVLSWLMPKQTQVIG
jgi:hypothetical protein